MKQYKLLVFFPPENQEAFQNWINQCPVEVITEEVINP